MKALVFAIFIFCCANSVQSCWPTVPRSGPGSAELRRMSAGNVQDVVNQINKGLEKFLEKNGDILCKVSDMSVHDMDIQVLLIFSSLITFDLK